MGPLLAAACEEFGRSGVVYVVDAAGGLSILTLPELAALTAEELRGCSVCLTQRTAQAEVAIRKRVRS